jgi:hypothetical protein
MAAGVLSMPEMEATSRRCCPRIRPCSRCSTPTSSRRSGGSGRSRRTRRGVPADAGALLPGVCVCRPGHAVGRHRLGAAVPLRAVAAVLELPPGENSPMPQMSKSVQLTHLRIAVTSEARSRWPARRSPEWRCRARARVRDRAGAGQAVGADLGDERRYGADLGEADKVWVDQQWVVVKEDDEMRAVALNNDRSQFEMVLEQKVKDLLIDRHDKNGVLFDLFFAEPRLPGPPRVAGRYLAGTYDEFRGHPRRTAAWSPGGGHCQAAGARAIRPGRRGDDRGAALHEIDGDGTRRSARPRPSLRETSWRPRPHHRCARTADRAPGRLSRRQGTLQRPARRPRDRRAVAAVARSRAQAAGNAVVVVCRDTAKIARGYAVDVARRAHKVSRRAISKGVARDIEGSADAPQSSAATLVAVSLADPGFWPVTRLPSTTAYETKGSLALV